MKPCPCGHLVDTTRVCTCAENEVHRYRSRLSGPLLDRIDLHLTLAPVPLRQLGNGANVESSVAIRERVERARSRQRVRFTSERRTSCNAQGERTLHAASRRCRRTRAARLSGGVVDARRGPYNRVIKVARTMADLAEDDHIDASHVAIDYEPQIRRAVHNAQCGRPSFATIPAIPLLA